MKQTIKVINHPIQSTLTIPGSKSITNRALLLAAMSEGVCEISNVLISDDTLAFVNALHELGILIQLDKNKRTCIVQGNNGIFPRKEASIWCAQAGTVARFLLAACASSPGIYHFDASEQLRRRPIEALIKILYMQGVKSMIDTRLTSVNHRLDPLNMPLTVKGAEGLKGGEIEVDGSETGQFISALLMAAPFAQSPMLIKAKDMVSRSYVDMTCAMMAEFGVQVEQLNQSSFSVSVPQRYAARNYVVEPDLSTASYFFAAAAVTGGRMTIQSIDRNKSKQGDVVFLSILEKMGCRVYEEAAGLTVEGPKELHGVDVDLRDASDIFMTLAAIAPFAASPVSITNIGHVRWQESDRLHVMRKELEKLGVKVEEGRDWLKVYPSSPHGGVVNPHHDHRIAMAFSTIGLRVSGIEIDQAECVSKTCPEFFELLQ